MNIRISHLIIVISHLILCSQVANAATSLSKAFPQKDTIISTQQKVVDSLKLSSETKQYQLLSSAFESENKGKRKGFILGLGLGANFLNTSVKFEGGGSDNLFRKPTFLTDFIIGAGINEQLLIYYSSKVHWFSEEGFSGDDIILTYGLGNVGATYFLKETIESPFVTGGIGFSSLNAPFEEEVEAEFGIGLYIGGGYQFADHFLVQAKLGYGNDLADDFRSRTLTLGVSVNYLLY